MTESVVRAGWIWRHLAACAATATIAGIVACAAAPARAQPQDACAAAAPDIAAARQAHDLAAATKAYADAAQAGSPCAGKALLCLGRSVALEHVAAAYARAAPGAARPAEPAGKRLAELEGLLRVGKRYGAPWQLQVALADVELDRAKLAHDAARYAEAAYDYQLALSDLAEDAACHGSDEPPAATAAQIAEIYRRMSTALLLAAPLKVATTKCSVCQWAFLAGIRDFVPAMRPLPITFNPNDAAPTPEGRQAIAALVECIKAQGLPRIVLSGHTDEVGPGSVNMQLSSERLKTVERLLREGGYTGEIVLEPKGKSEPYAVAAADGYSRDEIRRLNRRIELRQFAVGEVPSCEP